MFLHFGLAIQELIQTSSLFSYLNQTKQLMCQDCKNLKLRKQYNLHESHSNL